LSKTVPPRLAGRRSAERLLAEPQQEHLVQFYEEEAELFDALERFLGPGLSSGEPILVIATEDHCQRLMRTLQKFGVHDAVASGSFVAVDAHEVLAQILVDGAPDRDRFRRTLGELMERVTGGRPARVRGFGEMVDLLWRDGKRSAAIQLEELWNEAAAVHSFSLLCAYVVANLYKEGLDPQLEAVCLAHTHVISAPRPAASESEDGGTLDVDRLRDRVRLLEAENDRWREIEVACRRSAVERIHSSEERFSLLVDSVEDYAIFMLDLDGVIVTWNHGAERIKGYSASEIIGQHFSKLHPSEAAAEGRCERALDVARRMGRFEDEGWRVRKDGSRFWASCILTALRDTAGTIVGFAKVTRDLTARVRAEAERLQRVRLEEADTRKNEVLAVVGHELRNPLGAVTMVTTAMRRSGGSATEKQLAILDRQVERMLRIVGDLGDATRVMQDNVPLQQRHIEIRDVLANATEIVMPLMAERRHEFSVYVLDQGLLVNVDPERMTQVLGNILSNAAKYTPAGGRIRLRAALSGEHVEVSVQDNGRGIARDKLDLIFDLFGQAEPKLDARAGGLGIGLSVARKIVHAHGGEIVAQSDGPGRGSQFVVRLPRASRRSFAADSSADAE
jgi:PAS domain S-box-containing protein